MKRAKPNKDSLLICAQVRIGGSREHVSNDENFTQRNNTVIYWNHIRNVFIQNNTNYMIFLTTDTKQIEDEARKEFGNDKIIINDGINAHLDRESNLGSNCSKIEKTFLDFHSLQNCHMAIISESGFGKLGVFNRNYPNENLAMFSSMRSISEFKEQKIIVKNSSYDLYILK